MKINETSNNSFQNKVLIDTFIEQISALQTDVGNLQIADNNLAQALATKANTADISNEVSTGTLNATNGNIKTLKVQGSGSEATLENATIGEATIGTENVTQSNITNLEVMDVDAGTVRTGTIVVENDATISGNLAVQDVGAKDITSASVNTLNLTAAEADINKLEAQNAEVTGKLEVNDLEVSGNFTGVSNIESESIESENITSDNADIETLNVENIRNWVSQVMNQEQVLTPSPQLGNVDRYTIELPSFNGVFLLSWEDSDVLWSATVIGNGKSYGISWSSKTEENYITDIFQYNGKLYIRINCNGKLKYAYSATKELGPITIYFNMDGWTKEKSLEELCDEESHIENAYPVGTAWLGPVFIPRLVEGESSGSGINFKGSCKFVEIPSFADTLAGDVWNITDEAYTDNRFVEGAGKPINAGDDIVAVLDKIKSDSVQEKPLPGTPTNWNTPILLYDFGTAIICCMYDANFQSQYGEQGAYIIYKKVGDEWVSKYESTYYNPWIQYPTKIGNRLILFDGSGSSGGSSICIYSDNNGETWTTSTGSGGPYPTCLGRVILENGHIISATRGGALHKSEDNGATWNSIYPVTIDNDSDPSNYGVAPLILLNDGSILGTVASWGGHSVGLLRSTDEGHTWLVYSTGLMIGPSEFGVGDIIRTSQGTLIYNGGIYNSDTSAYIYGYRSTDDGLTWTPIGQELGKIVELNGILYSNFGLQSADDGITWTEIEGITRENYNYSDIAVVDDNSIWFSYIDGAEYSPERAYKSLVLYLGPEGEVLRWDKFSAGVNYDNFVAKNITATESLKSEGTLEVDGTSQFDDDVTVNADLNADKVITPDLEVTGTMTANNAGINVIKNVTHTGNYTQTGDYNLTGDQTVTGSVTISEKETINNLAPEEGGHYVDHDIWKYNNTFLTNGTNYPAFTTEPAGIAQEPVLLESNLYALSSDNANALYQFTENVKYQVIKINGSWCYIDNRSIFNPVDMVDPRDHRIGNESTYDYKHYIDENNHVYRYKESDDEFLQAKTNYQGGYGFQTITDATTIANLRSKLSQFTIDLEHATYYERSYKRIKTLSTGNATFISSSAPYPTNATLYGPFDLYYVQYKEYVREVDPNHQYTPADEVLTVNGSEKVTRDLKVQGFIYQDDYNRAILPNINANTINSNGGVLIIGDLD